MNTEVQKQYQANLARIEGLLANIQAQVTCMKAEDEPNWGHVGSASHAAEKLQELAEFLNRN